MQIKTSPSSTGREDHNPGYCSRRRHGFSPQPGAFTSAPRPCFFPSLRSRCPSLTVTLPLCILRPHAHLLAQLYLPVELPDFSIVMALPGILRVTAQPGCSWKSATRTLFWSPVARGESLRLPCILGLFNLKAGETGKIVTREWDGGPWGPQRAPGSPTGLRQGKFQEPESLYNQNDSGAGPWA